jgi:hypothetical protein
VRILASHSYENGIGGMELVTAGSDWAISNYLLNFSVWQVL